MGGRMPSGQPKAAIRLARDPRDIAVDRVYRTPMPGDTTTAREMRTKSMLTPSDSSRELAQRVTPRALDNLGGAEASQAPRSRARGLWRKSRHELRETTVSIT